MKAVITKQEIIRIISKGYEEICHNLEYIARVCYKSQEKITENSYYEFLKMIINKKHLSILEHESISVHIKTNRAIANELVRHRIGSYAQESTRYCNYKGKDIEFIPSYANDPEYNLSMYQKNVDDYNYLVNSGLTAQFARDILPLALSTEVIMTFNIRQWLHVLNIRMANACHLQMKDLMNQIYVEFSIIYPLFFNEETVKKC